MKIEKKWLIKFKHVTMGQTFEYGGVLYMKTSKINNLDHDGKLEILCNAVDLKEGFVSVFEDDEEVTLYENAKVVLI